MLYLLFYDFRVLHNDSNILATLKYYILFLKSAKLSNTAFLYISGFKFHFEKSTYHLNAFVLYFYGVLNP